MKKRWKILIVDDEPANLDVISAILEKKYYVETAENGIEALKKVQEFSPDLVLLDILMPKLDGFEVCKLLKKDPETEKIPVIFVSGLNDNHDESFGFSIGGVDYINKPISIDILLARIETHLELNSQRLNFEDEVERRTSELLEIQRATIYMLGEAGHYNDTDTGAHIWRMAAFAGIIAESIGWSHEKVRNIQLAAPMHDTGKIGIPDTILKKNASLDDNEWKIMKTHTVIGHNILLKSTSDLFLTAADIALYHHEKWDGTGYPVGLKGNQIPESARIVAIADVFDALTMKRPYKDAWPIDEAIEEIVRMSGTHFDPALVDAFLKNKEKIVEMKKEWDSQEEITRNKFMFPVSEVS